jgi:hypothetical protein
MVLCWKEQGKAELQEQATTTQESSEEFVLLAHVGGDSTSVDKQAILLTNADEAKVYELDFRGNDFMDRFMEECSATKVKVNQVFATGFGVEPGELTVGEHPVDLIVKIETVRQRCQAGTDIFYVAFKKEEDTAVEGVSKWSAVAHRASGGKDSDWWADPTFVDPEFVREEQKSTRIPHRDFDLEGLKSLEAAHDGIDTLAGYEYGTETSLMSSSEYHALLDQMTGLEDYFGTTWRMLLRSTSRIDTSIYIKTMLGKNNVGLYPPKTMESASESDFVWAYSFGLAKQEGVIHDVEFASIYEDWRSYRAQKKKEEREFGVDEVRNIIDGYDIFQRVKGGVIEEYNRVYRSNGPEEALAYLDFFNGVFMPAISYFNDVNFDLFKETKESADSNIDFVWAYSRGLAEKQGMLTDDWSSYRQFIEEEEEEEEGLKIRHIIDGYNSYLRVKQVLGDLVGDWESFLTSDHLDDEIPDIVEEYKEHVLRDARAQTESTDPKWDNHWKDVWESANRMEDREPSTGDFVDLWTAIM